jgi:hypothetical protein
LLSHGVLTTQDRALVIFNVQFLSVVWFIDVQSEVTQLITGLIIRSKSSWSRAKGRHVDS